MRAAFILALFKITYGLRPMIIPATLETGPFHPKNMFAVLWHSWGFHMIIILSHDMFLLLYDSLIKTCNLWWNDSSLGREQGQKKLVMHIDNANVDITEMASHLCTNNWL
jgi:hypothetical protein